jgi:putative phage-type endonuclease
MSLTPEQRKDRKRGLGGSDALAYCGRDPRKTPLELYLEKTGEAEQPEQPEPRKDWGSRLEPVVRDWLAEQLGRRIDRNRFYRSDELPFMVGNVDGVTEKPFEGVEIKTADKFMATEFGEVGTDQVPVRYVLQIHHYMIVTRLRRFHLAALVGGNDARHYIVDYDADLAAMLVARAQHFWDHVESHNPPAPVTLNDADIAWPKSLERATVADETITHALQELKTLRKAEAAAAASADNIEVTLKAFMGECDVLTDAKHKVLATWRTQERERFAQKEFAKDHPELMAQYRATSSFRVFRLK